MPDILPPGLIFLIALAGGLLGSFASVLITRAGTPYAWLVSGGKAARSACPSCGTPLRAADLVPVFSWLALKGKCRACGVSIPRFYIYLEIISALVSVLLAQWAGPGWALVCFLAAQPFALSACYLLFNGRKPPFIYIVLADLFLICGLLLKYGNQLSVQDFAL